jgi:hypothetical protein
LVSDFACEYSLAALFSIPDHLFYYSVSFCQNTSSDKIGIIREEQSKKEKVKNR